MKTLVYAGLAFAVVAMAVVVAMNQKKQKQLHPPHRFTLPKMPRTRFSMVYDEAMEFRLN